MIPQNNNYLRPDIVAGISMAGLLLPEAIAYSNIAGLSPQSGLIALLVGLTIYGLIGSSRFAIVSSTSSSAAVLGSSLAILVAFTSPERASLAYAIVFLSGILFVVGAIFKLGEVTHFIAKPVLKGFSFGLALSIAVKQLPSVLQIHTLHTDFFREILDICRNFSQWNIYALLMGCTTFFTLWFGKRFHTLPVALLLVIIGVILSINGYTASWNIQSVGHFEFILPKIEFPDLTLNTWLQLVELSIAVVFMVYAESYTSIRTFALKYNDTSEPNRDLLALGASNIISGLFQGMPVGAGYSATSANEAAGAQSKKSAWVAVLSVALILLLFRQYISDIPEPILASIVIYAVSGHIRLAPFKQYFAWKKDRFLVLTAICAVILFGVLNGLMVAIIVSIIMMLKSYAVPRIAWLGCLDGGHDYVDIQRFPQAKVPEGMLVVRPDEPIFFANAEKIFNLILQHVMQKRVKHVVISLEECPSLDSSSVEELLEFAQRLHDQNISLQLARVRGYVGKTLSYVNSPLLPSTSYCANSVDDAVTYIIHSDAEKETASKLG